MKYQCYETDAENVARNYSPMGLKLKLLSKTLTI